MVEESKDGTIETLQGEEDYENDNDFKRLASGTPSNGFASQISASLDERLS